MIGSFKNEETRRIFQREPSRRFGLLARVIYRKLLEIDAAITVDKLRSPPGNRLEALRADRAGQHSIRVNDQFRICFEWRDGHAYDIEVTDYH
ncbi:type II toxin-antitoxin system RelE/ParE family toxin [Granulicella paludicola]|uniref:type II toxin-antitoxin system RelE/ParE family toxin n=1 Tax=Granulicella paludicola TaxID=474951 RepID=UPI0021E02B96|nr:type II toxin-antitoxin system RelE/ParE family toxin [Granulicella paludicola]